MKRYALLIIDADNDFVDPQGSLFVQGADRCMMELSQWISKSCKNLTTVYCSQDAHTLDHIGFPGYWAKGPKGTIDPKPYMQVSIEDVEAGLVVPRDPKKLQWIKEYLGYLRSIGQKHSIWPYHSVDGTWGQAFPKYLSDTFLRHHIIPRIIRKGDYEDCEMYSIFEYSYPIDMPGLDVPESKALMRALLRYDKIFIAGVAKDYCVSSSIASLIRFYPKEIKNKLVFLRDAMATIDPSNQSLKIYDYCVKELGAIDCLMGDFEFI